MRRVVCHELAPLDRVVVEVHPDPVPEPDQVVVAVRAAGVNFVDGLFVQGKYQIKPPLPFIPGGEVAGDVVAVGAGVDTVSVGDRVVAMPWLGGFASHVEVSAGSVVPIPVGLSYGQAAGLVQSYGTMLFAPDRAHPAARRRVGARARRGRRHRSGRHRRCSPSRCTRHRRRVLRR